MNMKRLLLLAVFISAALWGYAQSNVVSNELFLNRFEKLVKKMNEKDAQCVDSVYAWKAERKKIQILYRERYRYLFSDDQIEEYSTLSYTYKSKLTEYKLEKIGEQVDSIGSKISKSLNRKSRQVSGFLKGLKKQSDENRQK